ncbi:MAG: hypothetical protein ACOX1V_03905 [Candidatus Iainarchaeum sp.]|nr:MAG: hypothetical protein BWY55_00768 [archaeon ADurb.Bin336]
MVRSSKVFVNKSSRKKKLTPNKSIAALKIFKSPAFRRQLYSPKVRAEAVDFLKKNLNVNFFESLPVFRSDFHFHSYKIRSFSFKGSEFIVKDTRWNELEGFVRAGEEHGVRKFMKAHHSFFREKKLRNNSKYILRTPKLIASIGKYLVLERIKPWHPRSVQEKRLVDLAFNELRTVLPQVEKKSNLPHPQIFDFIPTGVHNGKVVFYSVYDYA